MTRARCRIESRISSSARSGKIVSRVLEVLRRPPRRPGAPGRDATGRRTWRRRGACPPTCVRVDDVRRLDHRRQRDAPVGDVQVVVRADAAPRARARGRRRRGSGSGRPARARRARERAGGAPAAARACRARGRTGGSRPATRSPVTRRRRRRCGCDGRLGVDLAAEPADLALERVDQRLVAALEPAHDLAPAASRASSTCGASAPRCTSRGGRRSARRTSSRAAAPTGARPPSCPQSRVEPLLQRDVVEVVVVALQLAARDERREPGAAERAQDAGSVRNSFGVVIEKSRPSS